MTRSATAIAVLGGALLGAAYSSMEWAWPGAFLGVAALAWSLDQSESYADAALLSAAFGWAGYVAGFFWLQPALGSFWGGQTALSWGVWLAWGAWVALRFVIIGAGWATLRARGLGVLLSLVLPWVTVEWIYPAVFPFYLANPLIGWTSMAQLAALGGPLLLSAWICCVSAVVAAIASSAARRAPFPRRELGVVLITSFAALVYGEVRTKALDSELADADGLTVGVVQANVDVMAKRTERALSHRRHLEQSASMLSRADIDLVIWPETSYLYALPRAIPTSGTAVRAELRTPLLFGGIRKDDDGRRFNSALLIGPDGMIGSAYDKRFLIPFAEFVPLGDRLSWWNETAPTLSHFDAGGDPVALELGDWRIATPICYETIRAGYVRALVRATRAQLLVSLTNDGWFGDSPEPRIHLQLARLRAIEQGRYLVRATNTGISAIVDPLGRVVQNTKTFDAANLVGEVYMLSGTTLYAVAGDWPGYLSALAWALLLARRRRGWRWH